MFEVLFRQQSDWSYKIIAYIQNFFLDDIRETTKPLNVIRMIDRDLTVDPNVHMLVAFFEFTPTNSIPLQQSKKKQTKQLLCAYCSFQFIIGIQLETFSICISLDYLMILQNFFISTLPLYNTTTTNNNHELKSNSLITIQRQTSMKSDMNQKLDSRQRQSISTIQNLTTSLSKNIQIFNKNFYFEISLS